MDFYDLIGQQMQQRLSRYTSRRLIPFRQLLHKCGDVANATSVILLLLVVFKRVHGGHLPQHLNALNKESHLLPQVSQMGNLRQHAYRNELQTPNGQHCWSRVVHWPLEGSKTK